MKKGNKGQFYIIAAVIIIAVIIGLMSTGYLRTSSEKVRVYNLGDELSIESAKVIDYGVYNEIVASDSNELIETFLVNVEENLYDQDPGNEFIFVYGNINEVRIVNLAQSDLVLNGEQIRGAREEFGSTITNAGTGLPIETPYSVFNNADWKKTLSGSNVQIQFNNQIYNFNLDENQNFYMILKKQEDGNVHIDSK